jgi:hypothetical protein
MSSTVSLPRLASRRKLLSEMVPSGNSSAAATDSLSGVSGPTSFNEVSAGLRTGHLTNDSTKLILTILRVPMDLVVRKFDVEQDECCDAGSTAGEVVEVWVKT